MAHTHDHHKWGKMKNERKEKKNHNKKENFLLKCAALVNDVKKCCVNIISLYKCKGPHPL